MSPRVFRFLILSHLVLLGSAGVVDLAFPELVPAAAARALEEAMPPMTADDWRFAAFAVPWALAFLAGIIGLLFFRRWARSLSLWATVAGLAIYPMFGPSLSSAWAIALAEASATLWGAVLALAFFSPLADRFARPQ